MFNHSDLKFLNNIKTKTLTISLYLNVDQKQYTPQEIKTTFGSLLEKARSIFPAPLMGEIRRRLHLKLSKEVRGLVFFMNPRENIYYEFSLPRPVESGIYLEKNLHLLPLAKMLDEYERYLIMLFDKERAKFFSVFLGEIEDYREIKLYFPGRHKRGGFRQMGYQRHVDEHMRQNLEKMAGALDSFSRDKKFDRLILAGTPEALSSMKKILPTDLKKKIAGEFRPQLFLSHDKVLDQAQKVEEIVERKNESAKVNKWLKYLGTGGKSCSGLKNVLKMACQGRVLELLLDLDLRAQGYKCFSCNGLVLYNKNECSICGAKLEEVDLIDELVQTVFSQGGKIEFVAGSKELKKLKGVGARLRY